MPLKQPPRDANGEVVPHDHEDIGNQDCIIRRISPEHCVPDEKASGGRRVSSMVFRPSSDGYRGLSIDIEASIVEGGLDPRKFVTAPPFVGSVWFQAGVLRAETLKVGYDPLPTNLHHGEVWGVFTDGRRRRLLRAAAWYVAIDGVALQSG